MIARAAYTPKVPYDWESRRAWLELPFPEDEYRRRLQDVQDAMTIAELDVLLVYGSRADDGSVRWLSNFDPHVGSTVVVVRRNRDPVLITSGVLHGEPMHSQFWQTWIHDARPAPPGPGPAEAIADLVRRDGDIRVGVAGWASFPYIWVRALNETSPQVSFEPADDVMLGVRAIKTPLEIEKIRNATEIAGLGIKAAIETCATGVTERAVAAAAHEAMFDAGADNLAFNTAVVSGERAGLKHAPPTDRVIEGGEMVFLDMGARKDGYYSDISRVLVVGKPTDYQLKLIETAERMFDVWTSTGRPGMRVSELQRMTEEVAIDASLSDEYMPLGYGHGLGTSLFERPSLQYMSQEVLRPGMTFALEPMLVKLGVGTGVVEDTMLVTAEGLHALSGQPLRTYT